MYLEHPGKKTGAKKFICVFFVMLSLPSRRKKIIQNDLTARTQKKEKLMRSESDLGIFVLVSQ